MKLGNRIYYNQTGKMVWMTGEMQGDVLPHQVDEVIQYIDLEFGDETLKNAEEFHIENGQIVVTKHREIEKTPEQIRIEELENELLIQKGVI